MTSDDNSDVITRTEAIERIQAAQGRAIHRLLHKGGLGSRECHELRGRIDALNSTAYLLEEAPEPREWPCDREYYRALAQADLQVSVELYEDEVDDRDGRNTPAGHNQEVY